jgi:hypothetical protein
MAAAAVVVRVREKPWGFKQERKFTARMKKANKLQATFSKYFCARRFSGGH